MPGVKLTELRVQPAQIRNTAEKLQVTLDYTANWRMPPDRPEIQLQIPDFLQVFGFATAEVLDYTGLQKRQYPIKLYSCSDFESEFALQLPPGIEPVALPPSRQSFRSPAVNISRQVAFAGDTLTQKFRMQTVRTRLSVQDYDELKNLGANKVSVFLDACFSGAQRGEGMLASARGVAIKAKQAVPQGNMVIFSAASEDETAYPFNEKGHGLFTYYLLKKLKETKGNVTLGELGQYICEKVAQESVVTNGKSQTPTVVPSSAMSGEWRNWRLK